MKLGGFQKLDAVNYPAKVACTVFTSGCNFHCPYCHNPSLVSGGGDAFSTGEVLDYLKVRRKVIDAVVVSGGEPCVQPDLTDFLSQLKDMGFLVKLDTNGSFPEVLAEALDRNLVDYVAMDVKTSRQKYGLVSNVAFEKIRESVEIVKACAAGYEFRTTCVKGIVGVEDFPEIGEMISGARRYCLQRFNPKVTLDPEYRKEVSFSPAELAEINKILAGKVEELVVRGF